MSCCEGGPPCELAVVVCLRFGGQDIAQGFHQALMVEPRHTPQGGELDRLSCPPAAAAWWRVRGRCMRCW